MYNSYDTLGSGLAIGAVIGIAFIILVIAMIPTVFYLINLQNTLKAVSPSNQAMPPGQVWLLLIPLFGTVWHFIVVQKIADSLKAEFDMRQIPLTEQRPAYSVGLAMCICACCGIIPFLGAIAGIASLVLWIIYWVKTAEYKRKLLGQA